MNMNMNILFVLLIPLFNWLICLLLLVLFVIRFIVFFLITKVTVIFLEINCFFLVDAVLIRVTFRNSCSHASILAFIVTYIIAYLTQSCRIFLHMISLFILTYWIRILIINKSSITRSIKTILGCNIMIGFI